MTYDIIRRTIPAHVEYRVQIRLRDEWVDMPVTYLRRADAEAHPRLRRYPDSTRVVAVDVPEHLSMEIGRFRL